MTAPTGVVVGVGAERGLGAALCRRFAAEGYHLLVAGRTAEKIAKVVQTIRNTGGSAEPIACASGNGRPEMQSETRRHLGVVKGARRKPATL